MLDLHQKDSCSMLLSSSDIQCFLYETATKLYLSTSLQFFFNDIDALQVLMFNLLLIRCPDQLGTANHRFVTSILPRRSKEQVQTAQAFFEKHATRLPRAHSSVPCP